MLTKKMALVCLAACWGMGNAQGVELIDTGGRGMAFAAVSVATGAPDSDGVGGRLAAGANAAPRRQAAGAAPQSASLAQVPNPYCLLLIGLGMLGFTSRGQRNDVFARDP
ncbi:hypothetical protein ACFDR9_004306 [Janthinobacterium sp. CG_23.3]|uniref:hypothetical protein n=1 Tax=Janthinobacterium sp. CG_23.3 TaxID=3349634 RepID=UPI0038D4D2D0